MSQTSLISILVFVAGLGSGYFARSAAGMLQRTTQSADMTAIEQLNQEDIEATLARDQKRLIGLWAENAVGFCPGSPPAVGKQAIAAHNEKFHAQNPGLKVLSYTSEFKNLQVQDGLALRVVREGSRVQVVSRVLAGQLARERTDGAAAAERRLVESADALARVKEPQGPSLVAFLVMFEREGPPVAARFSTA